MSSRPLNFHARRRKLSLLSIRFVIQLLSSVSDLFLQVGWSPETSHSCCWRIFMGKYSSKITTGCHTITSI